MKIKGGLFILNNLKSEISLRVPQEECIEKAKNYFSNPSHHKFLIDAKCRFGKTLTSYYIAFNVVKAKVIVIFTGITTRKEWEKDSNNFEGENIRRYFNNEEVKRLDILNLDPNYIHVIYCNLMLKSRNEEVATKLINELGNRNDVCYIMDECHHSLGTDGNKKMLLKMEQNPNNKIIYLTGTSYTELCKSFNQDQVFKFTYEDEWDYYRACKLDYKPIRMELTIPAKFASILNKKNKSIEWLNLWESPKAKQAINTIIETIKAKNESIRNFLCICNNTQECKILLDLFHKFKYNAIDVSSGGENENFNSEDIDVFLKKDPDNYNFVITCSRFCTGATIRELQGCLFLCSTKSAIKFVQASFRCASQYKEENRTKKEGYIFCFEEVTAFEMIPRIYNNSENPMSREKFEKLKDDMGIKILGADGFKDISFENMIDWNDNYILNRDNLIENFKDENLLNQLYDFDWKVVFEKIKSNNSSKSKGCSDNDKGNKEDNPSCDKENSSPYAGLDDMKEPKNKHEFKDPKDRDKKSLENYITKSLINILETLTGFDIISIKDNKLIVEKQDVKKQEMFNLLLELSNFPLEAFNFICENAYEFCCKVIYTTRSRDGCFNN